MRKLMYCGAAAVLVLLLAAAGAYLLLRASLPPLDGTRAGPGISAPVRISRDARGVPTLEAANRDDLAYATGYVHAQDRFFQMDLARRLAGGELSELVGAVAVEQDKKTRLFRFRSVARAVLAAADAPDRAVLEAYARGVNEGLGSLGSRPWEYWLLGVKPAPWRAEDSVLVVYSMWWDLQANGLRRELLRGEINARLGGPECAAGWKCVLGFFYPAGTRWDAPDAPLAPQLATAPIPDASLLDVRDNAAPPSTPEGSLRTPAASGSNSWAVAGRLTASGSALIANDMHLGQRVPPVWYHARLRVAASATAPALDLNGVTLPGAAVLVAGSNGHLAWGFTNSYGDWLSVSAAPCSADSAGHPGAAAGEPALQVVREEIRVKGAAPVTLEVRSGPLGVLLQVDPVRHTCWFGSWLAQRPDATNLNLMRLERTGSVAEALKLAPQMGMPHQNVVLGDAEGHIAWSIFGRIPQDTGPGRARQGPPWTTSADHPQILDPPLGRLWTANARVTSDPHQLELIGGHVAALGAEYDLGARAGQIRDDLLALSAPATPADMLRIQLDDRAVFLARWRTLLLGLLDAASLKDHPRRAEFRRLVEHWQAAASVDSVGYRLVRAYHDRTLAAVWDMLLAALQVPADENNWAPAQFEGPLWQLVTSQPLHLLARRYASWDDFLRVQVDATLSELDSSCPELARCSWGRRNVVAIRHPLARAVPLLAPLLDMPTLELPGDHDMPRVQDGPFGASERFAVSPGHEAEGYLTIPGGQSGHPLSPYYRAGFLAWAHGEALPFLPGATQHTLTLTP
jgi:penicillin G amidase